MLLLLQCLTGDGWSTLMDDCLVAPPFCDPAKGECGSWIAVPFFCSFQVGGSFVILNLLVAVILENFSSLGNINSDLYAARTRIAD